MSTYNEFIKNFKRVRSYMRNFYIYSFKSREAFQSKSARSYDDEHRLLESWPGNHMSFVRPPSGRASSSPSTAAPTPDPSTSPPRSTRARRRPWSISGLRRRLLVGSSPSVISRRLNDRVRNDTKRLPKKRDTPYHAPRRAPHGIGHLLFSFPKRPQRTISSPNPTKSDKHLAKPAKPCYNNTTHLFTRGEEK